MKAVFSVTELSDYLGVSSDCIYTMVRENQIPFVRVRRRILFYRDSINSWIHTNTPYPK
nr:excisionase family DNA-binding protein [Paenibacillus sp. PastF-3]